MKALIELAREYADGDIAGSEFLADVAEIINIKAEEIDDKFALELRNLLLRK
jgi:hypothetical protein